MRKQLYQNLLDRLKATTDENNETAFATVGLWTAGAANALQAAQMPAALLECGETEWKTLGAGAQEALLTLKLHILTAPGSHVTEEAATAEVLRAFDLSARAYASLLAMPGGADGCRSLKRTASAAALTEQGQMDHTDTYQMLAIERIAGGA